MGHVINPVLLRLGVVSPWIAASYSRKNNKRIKYTIENFLIYKYIRQFFNQKVYLKILAKIRKRRKKFLKNFFFFNFPYIFSHLSIMRINSTYQLNLFFYDKTLQYFLNTKNKRFYKKKKEKKRKKTLILRKRKVKRKRLLKKYKNFFFFNNLFFKSLLKNKLKFNRFLIKKFPNKVYGKLKRLVSRVSRFKVKKRYYGYPKSFYQNLYKKKNRRIKIRKYYKRKVRRLNVKRRILFKIRKLRKIKKYLKKTNDKIKISLLRKNYENKQGNILNRYNLNTKVSLYKLNPVAFKIMNLKNKYKFYYYKTRNRYSYRNLSFIKSEFKDYRLNKKHAIKRKQKSRKKSFVRKLTKSFKGNPFNGLVKKKK
uniref:Mp26-like protein n=1 Tax=Heterostelium pallidum TaxID=13642 RepID=B2XX47_HETPA|nr:Mp26-like protein [Heterostelium pallidum]